MAEETELSVEWKGAEADWAEAIGAPGGSRLPAVAVGMASGEALEQGDGTARQQIP